MSNNEKGNYGPSWALIVVTLICFWPIGLFLLIKKMSTDKKAAVSVGGKGLKVTGIVLIVFAALGFLGFITSALESGIASGDIGGLVFLAFFAVGGVALINKSKKLKEEAESIKQYLSIIVNGNVRQLDTIAHTTDKPYEVVHKDIKKMIDKGYFKDAYIDEGNREVVLPGAIPAASQGFATATTAATVNSATVKTKIVTCPCCGANNTITGDVGECEYCGSPLN